MRVHEKVALSRDVAAGHVRCCHWKMVCGGDAEAGNGCELNSTGRTVLTAGGFAAERRHGQGLRVHPA